MSLKSTAIKYATKKVKKTKAGKLAFKTATIGGAVLGGTFIALLLANEGKRLTENNDKNTDVDD